jgi:hypothetical protein
MRYETPIAWIASLFVRRLEFDKWLLSLNPHAAIVLTVRVRTIIAVTDAAAKHPQLTCN